MLFSTRLERCSPLAAFHHHFLHLFVLPSSTARRAARSTCSYYATSRRLIPKLLYFSSRDRLLEKPDLYLDEMRIFSWDESEVLVTPSSISRALAAIGWSEKTARRVAKQQRADLRDLYLHDLSAFRSYHLVFVDESGCDKRIGFRQTAWSPLGVTPVKVAQFQREPACTPFAQVQDQKP